MQVVLGKFSQQVSLGKFLRASSLTTSLSNLQVCQLGKLLQPTDGMCDLTPGESSLIQVGGLLKFTGKAFGVKPILGQMTHAFCKCGVGVLGFRDDFPCSAEAK